MNAPDLAAARSAVDAARGVVDAAATFLAGRDADENQVAVYDLAHAASAVDISSFLLDYGDRGDTEARIATGGESDYIGMVIATEELSRGSLGAGGSLITRPEILI